MKSAARLVAVLGTVAVAWLLFRAAPREVTLVYDLGPTGAPARLDVRIARGAELLRRAEFQLPAGGGQARHTVKLRDGRYQLRFHVAPEGGAPPAAPPYEGEREVEVTESGTIVLPLGR